MGIGKMTEVVIFLKNVPTTSGPGATDNYSTLLTTRGQLIDKGGSRQLSYGGIADATSMTLICRFQTSLESNLRTDTKIIIGNNTYTFSHWKLIDQKKHLYQFEIQMLDLGVIDLNVYRITEDNNLRETEGGNLRILN
jgi:hypothetical protein